MISSRSQNYQRNQRKFMEITVSNVPPMTDQEYTYFSQLVMRETGIKLGPEKRDMLLLRLIRRLKAVQLPDFKSYIAYLRSKNGAQELIFLIDAVSTNKTDFFRESIHFDYIRDTILPRMIEEDDSRSVSVWSAGCSSGEEPYTIAMVLEDYFSQHYGWQYRILASDVSTRMLAAAQKGIYTDKGALQVPLTYRKKYIMSGKGKFEGSVRIVPQLRAKLRFARVNFRENVWPIEEKFDIIFCRNVIIYFDLEMQKHMFRKFYDYLYPGGYMIIGSSETLKYINEEFVMVGPTIYQRPY